MSYSVALFAMKTLNGNAARDHLAAGNPIYFREADTPPGTCVKKYPDGHCELVTFTQESGEVVVSELISAVEKSTQAANAALDDALAFVAESNKRIDQLKR